MMRYQPGDALFAEFARAQVLDHWQFFPDIRTTAFRHSGLNKGSFCLDAPVRTGGAEPVSSVRGLSRFLAGFFTSIFSQLPSSPTSYPARQVIFMQRSPSAWKPVSQISGQIR